jgi:hypothetical protein
MVLSPAWSELAATNAPVQDECIEAVLRMNKNPILPACMEIFFHLFSTPKFPPPTYHLPPPSYLPPTNPSPPHSIARALETSSRSELGVGAEAIAAGAWSKSLELGVVEAWSLELLEQGSCGWNWSGTHAGPR